MVFLRIIVFIDVSYKLAQLAFIFKFYGFIVIVMSLDIFEKSLSLVCDGHGLNGTYLRANLF
jgi:hypothetical protein